MAMLVVASIGAGATANTGWVAAAVAALAAARRVIVLASFAVHIHVAVEHVETAAATVAAHAAAADSLRLLAPKLPNPVRVSTVVVAAARTRKHNRSRRRRRVVGSVADGESAQQIGNLVRIVRRTAREAVLEILDRFRTDI